MKKKAKPAFSHFDAKGRARMVNVGAKPDQLRRAVAEGWLVCQPATIKRLRAHTLKKGDALTVAQIAGIQAAKQTANLIPLCHPLPLHLAEVDFVLHDDRVEIRAITEVTAKTGVEMEALTAVSIAGLALYDMCKAVDKTMTLTGICVVEKNKA